MRSRSLFRLCPSIRRLATSLAVASLGLANLVAWPQALSAAVLAEGTIVTFGPQGVAIQTASGAVTIPITRATRLSIRGPANFDDVPDGAPCIVRMGTVAPNSKELRSASLLIPVGPYRADASSQHIRIDSTGKADFQNVPGILRKGPPPTFQVGPRVEHLTLSPQGALVFAKRQDTFTNQSIPLSGGPPMVEYDFGSNLQMAGTGAKIHVTGEPNNPGGATIRIDRTEPFTPPAGKSK
jgi:hypothetical protein